MPWKKTCLDGNLHFSAAPRMSIVLRKLISSPNSEWIVNSLFYQRSANFLFGPNVLYLISNIASLFELLLYSILSSSKYSHKIRIASIVFGTHITSSFFWTLVFKWYSFTLHKKTRINKNDKKKQIKITRSWSLIGIAVTFLSRNDASK